MACDGNGTFVGAGGRYNYISYDGTNWKIYTTTPTINQQGIAYGNGMFMEFGTGNGTGNGRILQSTNGVNWKQIYTFSNNLSAAAYGNNTWVFVGNNEIVTANGTTTNLVWTDYQPIFTPSFITYGNGVFVTGARPSSVNGYNVFSSPDGITWQYDSSVTAANNTFTPIIYGNGVFVVSAYTVNYNPIAPYYTNFYYSLNNSLFVSSDLVNWDLASANQSFPSAVGAKSYYNNSLIVFGGNQLFDFIQGANPTHILSSSDGYNWIDNSTIVSNINMLTYGQGTFVASGSQNIYQSDVFGTDSNSPAPITLGISTYPGVTVNGTAGAVYQIQSSTDLNTWQTLTNFPLPYSPFIWIDTGSTANGQKFYRSVQLP